eukprot:scaffold23850_cov117-Cylindrotheca_fusiformis.AAC.1
MAPEGPSSLLGSDNSEDFSWSIRQLDDNLGEYSRFMEAKGNIGIKGARSVSNKIEFKDTLASIEHDPPRTSRIDIRDSDSNMDGQVTCEWSIGLKISPAKTSSNYSCCNLFYEPRKVPLISTNSDEDFHLSSFHPQKLYHCAAVRSKVSLLGSVISSTPTMSPIQSGNFSNATFTYPGWEEDLKSIEEELHESMTYFGIHPVNLKDTNSHRKMLNKQQLFDGTSTDVNMRRLDAGEFTYPDFHSDRENIMNKFREGLPIDSYMVVLEMKQRAHNEDYSHPLLCELKLSTFTYDGWEDDMKEADRYLFDLDISTFDFGNRDDLTKRQLAKMKKKQDIFDGRCSDCNLDILNSGAFTYPNFEKDRKELMELIDEKASFDEGVSVIRMRQSVYEGNKTNRVLSSLRAGYFTYDGWQRDKKEVKKILLRDAPMAMFESAESKAWRKLQGMENKQRVHDGCDPIGEILKSSLFTYQKFEADKASALGDYFEGLCIAEKVKSMLFQQEVYNGDRSHPILTAIDRAVVRGNGVVLQDVENRRPNFDRKGGKECVICMENQKTHAFVPCGHLALCENCAARPAYASTSSGNQLIRCPICRKKSAMIMRVYGL